MAFAYSVLQLQPVAYHHGYPYHLRRSTYLLGIKSSIVFRNSMPRISCAISMSDGQSGNNRNSDYLEKARKFWETLPHPVKNFPWSRVQDNFIQLILGIATTVIKYLSAPLLAVSALSEMSYCAHERKLFLVPIPLALGFIVAGVLKETFLELSPLLKDAEIPWHLIAIAIFFVLMKLPGPYYPYWGRLLIPHFANGALLRVFWMMNVWYQRPKEPISTGSDSLEEK